jgi:drug/metabolite transporter (DMT)-like permease
VFWGWSFPVMQISLGAFERAVVTGAGQDGTGEMRQKMGAAATFNGWRFCAAALAYWALTRRRQVGYTPTDWLGGGTVGVFLGAGMLMQLTGLRYALPSVSGFLTALPVVFAPVAQAWLFRRRVTPGTWAAVGVAALGIAVLSQSGAGAAGQSALRQTPPVPFLGEALTVVGSMLFTGQILAVDRYGPKVSAAKLTCVMMAVTGLVNAAGGLALIGGGAYSAKALGAVARDGTFWWTMISLVVISSVVAMHLMNQYQPRVSPATASVVYCLEPLFATTFSVVLGTERLAAATVCGGAIILGAVLMATRAARSP